MNRISVTLLIGGFCLASCTENIKIARTSGTDADICPDYKDVTIPPNIAPLNFRLPEKVNGCFAWFECKGQKLEVTGKTGSIMIPEKQWKKLLTYAKGNFIKVTAGFREKGEWTTFNPFSIAVAADSIDPYLAYRLIEPGYEIWNQMGIYQRDLESFRQTAIIENRMINNGCMNCHSFCMQNPAKMIFHTRGGFPGTLLVQGDSIEKLNTKTDETISALVYPSWHPGGKYIAFSVNETTQGFHTTDRNRTEVFDLASDVVVYDVEKHEIVSCPLLFSTGSFETFPTFSPDGKTLYFCSSPSYTMPDEFTKVRYHLCSVSFDPKTRKFGHQVDTLFHADIKGKSASFPRISPDGRFLLYSQGDYGGFFIWHKEADLHLINLKTEENLPLEAVNSNDSEGYHAWSSNSKWIVFGSKRMDGLYTRLYIAHIDENGHASKAFVLPQKDTDFYDNFMKSYNVPEFINAKVNISSYNLSEKIKNDKGINLKFYKE